MEYPGGFSDDALYPIAPLEERFGGALRSALRQGEELGLPLIFSPDGEGVGGEALPFLLLLASTPPSALQEAHYDLMTAVLQGERRGDLLKVMAFLGEAPRLSLPTAKTATKETIASATGATKEVAKASGERRMRQRPQRRGDEGLGAGEKEGEKGGLHERLEVLESEVQAQALALSNLAEVVARVQRGLEELTEAFRKETELWGQHVSYVNDRSYLLQSELQGLRDEYRKAVDELRGAVQDLDMQLQSLKRMIVPK